MQEWKEVLEVVQLTNAQEKMPNELKKSQVEQQMLSKDECARLVTENLIPEFVKQMKCANHELLLQMLQTVQIEEVDSKGVLFESLLKKFELANPIVKNPNLVTEVLSSLQNGMDNLTEVCMHKCKQKTLKGKNSTKHIFLGLMNYLHLPHLLQKCEPWKPNTTKIYMNETNHNDHKEEAKYMKTSHNWLHSQCAQNIKEGFHSGFREEEEPLRMERNDFVIEGEQLQHDVGKIKRTQDALQNVALVAIHPNLELPKKSIKLCLCIGCCLQQSKDKESCVNHLEGALLFNIKNKYNEFFNRIKKESNLIGYYELEFLSV